MEEYRSWLWHHFHLTFGWGKIWTHYLLIVSRVWYPLDWTNKFLEEYLNSKLSICQFHLHFKSSFFEHRSQKLKKRLTTWLSFFALSGSANVKAAHRMLMKSTPDVNFINILQAAFSYKKCFTQLTSTQSMALLFFVKRILVQKRLVKWRWNWLQINF